MHDMFGDLFCIYKSHAAAHIPDDVETMGVHLDAISAYPFENMMQVFGKYVRTGKNPLKQLTNGLARNRHLRDDRVKCELRNGKHALPSLEDDLKRFHSNGQSLNFKATDLVQFYSTSFMDHAMCEGVEITNK